jgi:hypothetical protein
MIVIDKGASSGADTTLESIQLPHRLWLLDPRQEQCQLEAVAARYGKDIKLFRETKRLLPDLANLISSKYGTKKANL